MFGTALKAVAVIVLGTVANALPSVSPYKGEKVVQVLGADTPAKVDTLEQNVKEVFIRSFSEGGMTARVNSEQAAKLGELGFKVKVLVPNLADHLKEVMLDNEEGAKYRAANVTDPEDVYFTRFHDYLRIEAYLDELMTTKLSANVKPEWMVKKMIGRSLEQRPIWAIELGNPKAPESVYIEGCIHAREWVSVTSLQYIIREWVKKYASGEDAALFKQFKFHFAPLVNPDGYRFSYLHERLWRKNRRVTHNATCPGVNLNRNYNGYNGWKFVEDTCSTNYAGTGPYSEPETKVLVRYLEAMRRKSRVLLAMDIHSYDQSILYPYGYDFNLPDAPNKPNLVECGNQMSAAMEASSGKVYSVKSSADLYPASGCTDDWYYDKISSGPWNGTKGIVYTVEMRPTEDDPLGFVLPPDQILSAAQEMLAGFNTAVEYVRKAVTEAVSAIKKK